MHINDFMINDSILHEEGIVGYGSASSGFFLFERFKYKYLIYLSKTDSMFENFIVI